MAVLFISRFDPKSLKLAEYPTKEFTYAVQQTAPYSVTSSAQLILSACVLIVLPLRLEILIRER